MNAAPSIAVSEPTIYTYYVPCGMRVINAIGTINISILSVVQINIDLFEFVDNRLIEWHQAMMVFRIYFYNSLSFFDLKRHKKYAFAIHYWPGFVKSRNSIRPRCGVDACFYGYFYDYYRYKSTASAVKINFAFTIVQFENLHLCTLVSGLFDACALFSSECAAHTYNPNVHCTQQRIHWFRIRATYDANFANREVSAIVSGKDLAAVRKKSRCDYTASCTCRFNSCQQITPAKLANWKIKLTPFALPAIC